MYRSENIICGWREHFAELAKESVQETFDKNYLNATKFEYEQIIKICQHEFPHEDVTIEELDKAILSLNRGKSSAIFGVTAECILYGGDKLKDLLLKLINLTFEQYSVPDLLKVGTLTAMYKTKGLMTESKNYRGITITPTLSKIIETILKFRINGNILSVQNPLQRGFTENSTPLMASLILEEFERENKDRKTPTIIGMLDAKSAFDVVRHTNLIRKLYHYGISTQSILLIDSLYRNTTTKIKWKSQLSEEFKIEQGVRHGATLSADLYKIYMID